MSMSALLAMRREGAPRTIPLLIRRHEHFLIRGRSKGHAGLFSHGDVATSANRLNQTS